MLGNPSIDSLHIHLVPLSLRIGRDIVHKADNQLPLLGIVLKCMQIGILLSLGVEHKGTLLIVSLLVVVLLGGSINQTEVNSDAVSLVGLEGIILEVLRCLDIVLVLVSPIELNLLTLVRDSVNTLLIATLRDKVAIVVVTTKERIERRIYI